MEYGEKYDGEKWRGGGTTNGQLEAAIPQPGARP